MERWRGYKIIVTDDDLAERDVSLSRHTTIIYSRDLTCAVTIDKNNSPSKSCTRAKIRRTGEEKEKEREKIKKNLRRGRARTRRCSSDRDTQSPELCNSLLKQSHPGTLSATLPPPLTHQNRPREPARYNIKKEDERRRRRRRWW